VVVTGYKNNLPIFRGVEILTAESGSHPLTGLPCALQLICGLVGEPVIVRARQEVILSAGAVKSPQLLMLSGIGDVSHIESVGVESLVHLPDVGQNLQDHIYLPLPWTVTFNAFTLDQIRENATFATDVLGQWNATRTGPFVSIGGTQFGWFRIPTNSPVFANATDPSAGPTSAHYEFIAQVGPS
jgi:choline dehydrogenase-like flavoprotein